VASERPLNLLVGELLAEEMMVGEPVVEGIPGECELDNAEDSAAWELEDSLVWPFRSL
jgi:hypothetical protein